MDKHKNKANTITIEQAQEDYREIIAEAIEKNMWLKAKGLQLWSSPYELQESWKEG